MPPRALPVPCGTFVSHTKHLRLRLCHLEGCRSASSFASALWRGQDPIAQPGQGISGSMEWQTSMYSFNKQHVKTIPTAATNIEKLIQSYVTMQRTDPRNTDARARRSALNMRRRSENQVYVSKPRIRDYGNRMDITVYVYVRGQQVKFQRDNAKDSTAPMSTSEQKQLEGASLVLTPDQKTGLQSLISKIYGKPVALNLVRLNQPHLDAEILASLVTQQLRDRRNMPRRIIRDVTWRSPLPTPQKVVQLQQKKQVQRRSSLTWADFTMKTAANTTSSSIVDNLTLSQVTSVQVEAAGRLTKRLTANRSVRKMARRGATTKVAGRVLRGVRKSHVQYALMHGKRRVGAYGIRVSLGHT